MGNAVRAGSGANGNRREAAHCQRAHGVRIRSGHDFFITVGSYIERGAGDRSDRRSAEFDRPTIAGIADACTGSDCGCPHFQRTTADRFVPENGHADASAFRSSPSSGQIRSRRASGSSAEASRTSGDNARSSSRLFIDYAASISAEA
ncbi:hypothetical protein [Prosthecobacter sp.]|uniref:hypothetical protein n=1 Tax=Prosthecobacter sp. TaxID=1965333 RepID=UPI002ABC2104|nr:hypothetical protein [Prosthecobacter sp.]MDZ4402173.1 hypothetical protein [Prosthecobacter sp.]